MSDDRSFATIEDVGTLWRPLTLPETVRAKALLPLVSDVIRQKAFDVGQDFDSRLEAEPALKSVAKIVTVDIVSRVLRQNTEGEMMAQESQGGMGYTWSGTYAIPGGGIANALMNNDLKRLGLLRQRYGTISLWPGLKEQQ